MWNGTARARDGSSSADSAHLSRRAQASLLAGRISDEELVEVRRHLRQCSVCRTTLKKTLANDTAACSPAQEMLQAAEEWAQMMEVGEIATQATRADLHAKGIRPVFMENGELMEELPDGSARRIDNLSVSRSR